MSNSWHFWIDVGGTFTDCLARNPDGNLITYKILSSGAVKGVIAPGSSRVRVLDQNRKTDPSCFFNGYTITFFDTSGKVIEQNTVASFDSKNGAFDLSRPLSFDPPEGMHFELTSDEEAPIVAIRHLMGLSLKDTVSGVEEVRLGTTRGTNALLEHKGVKTALITTAGIGDILEIGYQNRPRLFDLNIKKHKSLYAAVVELRERISATGRVLVPLNLQEAESMLLSLKKQGIFSLAICFLHSYRNPIHEKMVAGVADKLGFLQVSVSSSLSPMIKIIPRADTTVADAYLTPILKEYLKNIKDRLPGTTRVRLMTSAGGLVDESYFVGKDSILSGPAGGVVGFSHVAREAGFKKAIGLDMGGTSTDVSRYDGFFEYQYEAEKAGIRISAPMLAIETVAAGGGSICSFDGQKLVVGPESAGSNPGPACYGRGGPLALTDINLYLGKILPEFFPFPLDKDIVHRRLEILSKEVETATGKTLSTVELAEGFTQIANANMAAPIKKISIARGYDVRDYTLVIFGAAGAQHACALSGMLGIRNILAHPYAGVLSAYGLGLADVKRFAEQTVLKPYSKDMVAKLESLFKEMEHRLSSAIKGEGVKSINSKRMFDLRYCGQSYALTVEASEKSDVMFEELHRRLYGHTYPGRGIEIAAVRVEMTGEMEKENPKSFPSIQRDIEPIKITKTIFNGKELDTAVFLRENLLPGDMVTGPAIIIEPISTIVVEPDWEASVSEQNFVLISAIKKQKREESISCEVDPIQLEIFNNHFANIAEEMGVTLQKIALSVNVKERLDFSCGVFNPDGELVANAQHIPVHIGAMGECIKQIIHSNTNINKGDVFVTNDPFRGGSHLPDITVVTPVHNTDGNSIIFFVASRAHHAEIGGKRPGSFPPDSINLAEEGVVIRDFKVIDRGYPRIDELKELLTREPYPSRTPEENIADISAQIAANQVGINRLSAMLERYGLDVVHAYMKHIQKAAEQKMRASLSRIPKGEYKFVDYLDDGSPLSLTITINGGEATLDFTGTGAILSGNLNAVPAIVASATLYALRCLINEDIPLNWGVLAPVKLIIPPSFLNPPMSEDPEKCPAVVGGNVETSQRIVDVIFGALGVVAASQGTMNNFIFGNEKFGYYETICGGAGAGPGFDGADAVHTHMTNTRLTDIEVLESRYPVRVLKFQIRRGSGGKGKYRGGDGVIKEIEFLEPVEVSILSQRRVYQPYGLMGGEEGTPGINMLLRKGSFNVETLPPIAQFNVDPGDRVIIETPGGGGYG